MNKFQARVSMDINRFVALLCFDNDAMPNNYIFRDIWQDNILTDHELFSIDCDNEEQFDLCDYTKILERNYSNEFNKVFNDNVNDYYWNKIEFDKSKVCNKYYFDDMIKSIDETYLFHTNEKSNFYAYWFYNDALLSDIIDVAKLSLLIKEKPKNDFHFTTISIFSSQFNLKKINLEQNENHFVEVNKMVL